MDKNAIKTFAVESRRKMIESVKYQASLIGITADGIAEPISKAEGMETYDYGAGQYTIYDEDIKKRESLVREINNKGFENVVEEVAYTWFNRIIAIRFMEVNDYLPTRTRVLSSEEEGKKEPDIVTEALNLDFLNDEKDKIHKLKYESKLDELFQFLFIKQCNNLNEILPRLFEKTDDYIELLLDINFTNESDIIRQLVDTIFEEDFRQGVEIVGWLYQFYISERKDLVNNALKSKPIKKEDIPAATQLFTPDWIVKYMVDNSLGRYWMERNNTSSLKGFLKYLFDEGPQDEEVIEICNILRSIKKSPISLKFFDPCMGSGHILIYAFDVFFEIYKELGYLESEIPELILKNNLYGLDIDKRAYQLAYFALMMQSRKYDRKFFEKNITPNIFPICDGELSKETIDYIKEFNSKLGDISLYLNNIFENAREFGSLIQLKTLDFDFIDITIKQLLDSKKQSLPNYNIFEEVYTKLLPLINQAKLLSSKYEFVVTNPPYLNKYDKNLRNFSKRFYKDYSRDLFSMFIFRNFDFCTDDGYTAFMTPMVWMFIKNLEKLRKFIINKKSIISLIEMEYHTLWEIDAHVPVCTFILSNQNYNSKYSGSYIKLTEYVGGLEVQHRKVLDSLKYGENIFYINAKKFNQIPGSPIAYWMDSNLIDSFKNEEIQSFCDIKIGLQTGENKKFLRNWYEIEYNKFCNFTETQVDYRNCDYKWFPYNKGGLYRKWYGNHYLVVDWENNGFNIKNDKLTKLNQGLIEKKNSKCWNENYYFKEAISWSKISSGNIAFRYYPEGFIFDVAGVSLFVEDNFYYIFGFLNSNVSNKILECISPTLNYEAGHISSLPLIYNKSRINEVEDLVKNNITICKNDWDDYETSWNFKNHPFLNFNNNKIMNSFDFWSNYKKQQFNILKTNESDLNQIFSDIYKVNLDNSILDKYVSLNLADYEKDIKSFISYSVGCMFGRYSLDEEGLQFAGGEFNISNYSKFIPDDDNIIPVLDTEYFNDDIVGRFVEFVKVCFGEETLEENLDFIAGALKKKGKTSREIIRNYFLTDFFKDHAQTYKKCPIYWQFDSGKQNAFKCLIYMHRYEPGLVARVRTDYLHKTQKAIEQNLAQCESIIANSSNKSEISKAKKDKTKYIKQLDEIKVYDEALAHIANQRIEIDLDDGVKVNHAKFQNVEISKEGQKAKKINLLKKI